MNVVEIADRSKIRRTLLAQARLLATMGGELGVLASTSPDRFARETVEDIQSHYEKLGRDLDETAELLI